MTLHRCSYPFNSLPKRGRSFLIPGLYNPLCDECHPPTGRPRGESGLKNRRKNHPAPPCLGEALIRGTLVNTLIFHGSWANSRSCQFLQADFQGCIINDEPSVSGTAPPFLIFYYCLKRYFFLCFPGKRKGDSLDFPSESRCGNYGSKRCYLKKTSEEKKDIKGEGLAGYRQGQGAG